MRIEDFDFELPTDRIALRPVRPRDRARLLVVEPGRERPFADSSILSLPELLAPGDALVLNDTRVIPAALEGLRHRAETTARVSVTLVEALDESRWRVLAKPIRRLAEGDRMQFGHEGAVCLLGTLDATVETISPDGVVLAFAFHGPALDDALAAIGAMPLPPYIAMQRPADDQDTTDYQTVFAREEGAIAAPTAGLHFTESLLATLEARGISRHFVTLHVGPGTFLPVRAQNVLDHRMHSEVAFIDAATADALNTVRRSGGRIVAVGTTALRVLETAADETGRLKPFGGATNLFITPGYRFRAVDRLLTNFHQPRSTLFMLVAAFSGLDTMQKAYAHAIHEGYRFYSYGDACLLSPAA